jgi:hypothetical protein
MQDCALYVKRQRNDLQFVFQKPADDEDEDEDDTISFSNSDVSDYF